MAGVHFSSHTNSTKFTDCCQVAICDNEDRCPRCKNEIYPQSAMGRHDMAMERLYGRERLKKIRAEGAKRFGPRR